MSFPEHRPRRLRRTPALRELARETRVTPADLYDALFVVEGSGDEQRKILPMFDFKRAAAL